MWWGVLRNNMVTWGHWPGEWDTAFKCDWKEIWRNLISGQTWKVDFYGIFWFGDIACGELKCEKVRWGLVASRCFEDYPLVGCGGQKIDKDDVTRLDHLPPPLSAAPSPSDGINISNSPPPRDWWEGWWWGGGGQREKGVDQPSWGSALLIEEPAPHPAPGVCTQFNSSSRPRLRTPLPRLLIPPPNLHPLISPSSADLRPWWFFHPHPPPPLPPPPITTPFLDPFAINPPMAILQMSVSFRKLCILGKSVCK